MPQYSARVVDKKTGNEFKIVLSADDELHASTVAQSMGFTVLNVQPVRIADPDAVFRGYSDSASEAWRPGSALNSAASFLAQCSSVVGTLGALALCVASIQMVLVRFPSDKPIPQLPYTGLLVALGLAMIGRIVSSAALEVSRGKRGEPNLKLNRILAWIWLACLIFIPLVAMGLGVAMTKP